MRSKLLVILFSILKLVILTFVDIDFAMQLTTCLVPKKLPTVSITSNLLTHAWSLNGVEKIINYAVRLISMR